MPILVGGLSQTLFSTGIRKAVTGTCALIVAVTGAIAGIKAEASDIEYVIPAHRGYVRFYTDDRAQAEIKNYKLAQAEVQRTVAHIQRELADGKRESVDNDLFKWKLELGKATDDQSRALISEQIRKLEGTKLRLDNQIETLDKTGN